MAMVWIAQFLRLLPPAAWCSVRSRPLSCPLVSALLRGFCGARRRRSFCFALAPFRFWLPRRSGPPRKAASWLGSRAHSLSGARVKRVEQEKRMYLNRITLIGFIGSDAERKVSNLTNIAIFSLATKTSWKNDGGSWESRTEWHRCVAFGRSGKRTSCRYPPRSASNARPPTDDRALTRGSTNPAHFRQRLRAGAC